MTDLIGIEEAAKMCGQSVSTLRWWRAQSKGPRSATIGRRVMYKRSEVADWIDRQFDAA